MASYLAKCLGSLQTRFTKLYRRRYKPAASFSLLGFITKYWKPLAICGGTGWLSLVIASGAGWNPLSVPWNFANPGAFGDSFGPISTTMAAIAAVAAIAAYNEQKREVNRIQQRENQEDRQREQDRRELEILRRQDALDQREQRDENTFFHLLDTFQDIVRDTDIQVNTTKVRKGRDAFKSIVYSFESSLSINDNVNSAWRNVAVDNQNDLNHYFRLLYHIVVFVDQSSLQDKLKYLRIVRALLSESELTLLALNCAYGDGREKFKRLVERYALLHSLSDRVRSRWDINNIFEQSAFGHGSS